ncbi:MAG: glycosyltransferase family 4 protein [Bacteroidota bacterium]|nr:glycosyltransferase family 4 protein [Bacteroidota bacterium]
MKIVHVVMNYYPSLGGTQWLFQNISERLVKNYGDEVTVLTIDSYYGPEKKIYKKIFPAIEIHNGVLVKRFSFRHWHQKPLRLLMKVSAKLFGTYPASWKEQLYGPHSKQLLKALQECDTDVICGSSSAYTFMQYPLWRKHFKRKYPFVYMGAVHFTERENEQVLDKKMLQSINASEQYIANTSFEKERLMVLGIEEDKIQVNGCGVDPDLYAKNGNRNILREKFGILEDDIVVGFVGRQERMKNIEVLISAVKEARKVNNKIHLIIAGASSGYSDQLQILVNDSNRSGNKIHVLSDIDEITKINLFHAMDIFASASASESFGIVFVEAWACRKPVIGSDIGAIRCIIDHEANGLLAEPFSVAAFANAIVRLAANQQERDAMAEQGYDKMLQQYTWDVVTKKYRDTYIKAKVLFEN